MKEKHLKIDFVCIGASKSATTWLYECLREHPGVYLTAPKDREKTSFFVFKNFRQRISDFPFLFEEKNRKKVKGNFSVCYLEEKEVAERIKEYNPQMKIIVCLRNPVERAYSHYFHGLSGKDQDWKSFEEAIKKSRNRVLGPGFYYKLLKRYYDNFPKENILIVFYRNIKKQPEEVIKKALSFLEIDSSFKPEHLNRRVAPTQFKTTRLGKLTQYFSSLFKKNRMGKKMADSAFAKRSYYILQDFYTKRKSGPPMKPKTRQYLKNVYREDIEKLEELINKDFNSWK